MATSISPSPVPAHELVYTQNQLPKLRSNHGQHLDPTTVGWMKQTPITTPLAEMRRRFQQDGYLFLKHLIPRSDVLDMREAYFTHLSLTHILQPGTSPRDGIFNSSQDPTIHNGVGGTDLPEDAARVHALVTAHTLPSYHTWLQHPRLRAFVRDFTGWEKEVLTRRTLLRQNVPHGFSTGIHYDRIFLRAGEAEFLTAWVPIGDCTAAGGGLMYLEDSTDIGMAMEREFMKMAQGFSEEERVNGFNVNMAKDGQLSHDASELTKEIVAGGYATAGKTRRWLIADYEAGDVVFHNPYMIHGAAKNEDSLGRIRLSTDLRFYEEGAPLDKRWMQSVWHPDDGL